MATTAKSPDPATEVCIIGSGMGGGTLALELAARGIKCLLLEAGDSKRRTGGADVEVVGRPFGLAATRRIQLGGTSNLWHGILAPLDPIDFEQRDWIPHSGWPFALEELSPFYERAAVFFGVVHPDYFDAGSLPEELRARLADLPFDRNILNNKLYQQPLPTLRLDRHLRKAARTSQNLEITENATALELQTDEQGSRVTALKVGHPDGATRWVGADRFVIAAGAIETPRLLLNSPGNDGRGLGNSSDQVGRYLMDHPMGNLFQIRFINPQKAHIYGDMKFGRELKVKSGLALSRAMQMELRLPNHSFFVRPAFVEGIDNETEKIKLALLTMRDSGMGLGDLWKIASNFNVAMQITAYRFGFNPTYRFADLFFVTEQIPNPDSRVTLSEKRDRWNFPIAKLDWRISPQDAASMDSMYQIIRHQAFGEENFSYTHGPEALDWDNVMTSAAHHLGTARMGSDKAEGVVDANLRVDGLENLYICDGSVFPTSGNANPSLTIAALAIRLADYLLER